MGDPSPGGRRVLVLDDDPAVRETVVGLLTQAGYQVLPAPDVPAGLAGLASSPDALILDLDLPSAGLMDRLAEVRRAAPGVPVLLLVDPERHHAAVRALRHGAEDYVIRPPDPFELKTRLARILERHEMGSRIALLQEELSRKSGPKQAVGRSPSMRALLDRVLRVAPTRAAVLISGESGVGKELIARAIHQNSPRRDQPFVALNCAAIPANLIESELFGHEKGSFTGAVARARGKFELAHRGTLFLDEIGEMDPGSQAKLLRVLEEREFMRVGGDRSIHVDVRLIAATNADLEALVARSQFRQDLYYRLKVVTLHVPALRDRREDIPELVETFVEELSRSNAVRRKAVTAEAMEAFRTYAWPGNVRELKNVLESLLVASPGDAIRIQDLPVALARASQPAEERAAVEPGATLAEMERALILATLRRTGGNRTHSAEMLGIGVRTLQRKIREYGIAVAPTRRRPRGARKPS